ncbi:type II toxin-antitoxin system RelE/ParE family toxin [Paraburkholderia strydomiana]|uniref:type II toxin-antitoxin system RelE/ParE family toxin n=1 Tax=Paraburkholderia strydomiana TaxID=1245417 RepID=UPI001BE79023|nr:type II toxin-antitoxin system RelE/ParE family toxin [Paraburkholderia strydomiana]MBT2792556.1 type II toxin-antitoxin system RelE/ParE family toxin [Paraburkholderia strydomiana]
MNWRVQFAPEALAQLQELEQRIANAGAPLSAERYVDAIVEFCMKLQTFAGRGVARDDLLPGLRITHFRKRAIIAYTLEPEIVSIVGVFYGGHDYEASLATDDE